MLQDLQRTVEEGVGEVRLVGELHQQWQVWKREQGLGLGVVYPSRRERHDPLQSFAVASSAVSKPGGDAAGQDALHTAGVEGSEDAGARSKLPQPSQEEEALMCLLQHCICVSGPCEILGDVNAEELKAVYPLHRCLVDGDGCGFFALSPEIHHQLLGLVDVE